MTHAMTSSSFFRTLAQAACLTTAALSFPAAASVIINGTRVIYNGAEKEVSVRLTNTGTQPVLVQSWTDEGDANATPDRIRTPFTLSPPVNRINSGKGSRSPGKMSRVASRAPIPHRITSRWRT